MAVEPEWYWILLMEMETTFAKSMAVEPEWYWILLMEMETTFANYHSLISFLHGARLGDRFN
jgi:hypothetical protein